jgi:hypothetical protein
MTYFYETSLSRIDKTFLRSITDKKAKEFKYQLKNPALITDRKSESLKWMYLDVVANESCLAKVLRSSNGIS